MLRIDQPRRAESKAKELVRQTSIGQEMASRLFIYAHTEQDNSRIDRIVGIRVRTVGCKKSYNQMSEKVVSTGMIHL